MPYQVDGTRPQYTLDLLRFEMAMATFGEEEGVEVQADLDAIIANPTAAQQLKIIQAFAQGFTVSPPPP